MLPCSGAILVLQGIKISFTHLKSDSCRPLHTASLVSASSPVVAGPLMSSSAGSIKEKSTAVAWRKKKSTGCQWSRYQAGGKKMPFAVPTPNKLFDPCSVVSALLKGRRSPLLKDQLKSLDYTRSAFVYYLHSWVICFCRASKSIHSDKAGAEVGICQTGI